jgi:hypothetical protein
MLSSMLNRQCGNSPMSCKFGAKITESSLQHNLDGLRTEMDRFIDENPQVVKRLSDEGL